MLPPTSSIVVEALPAWSIAWSLSKNGRFATTLAKDGMLDVWSVNREGRAFKAHLLQRVQTPPWPGWSGGKPSFVAIASSGTYVALRRPEGGFDVRRVRDGRIVRQIDVPGPLEAWNVAWLPSGRGLLVDSGGADSRYQPTTRLLNLDAKGDREIPVSAPWVFSSDGRSVLGSFGGGLALVDLATGRVRRRFLDSSASFEPYAISPDGRLVASSGEDPNWQGPVTTDEYPATEASYAHTLKIKVWRVSDERRILVRDGFFSGSSGDAWLAFLDGRHLILPHEIFDVVTRRSTHPPASSQTAPGALLSLPPAVAHPTERRPVSFPGAPALREQIAVSPDGRFLVVPEFNLRLRGSTRLLVWNLPEHRLLRRLAVSEVRNLNRLGFVSNDRLRLKGPKPYPLEFSLTPDGRIRSRRVVEEPTASAWFKLFPDPVRSADGRHFLRATQSGLEFCDVRTGAVRSRIAEFEQEGENALAATNDGFAVVRRNRDLRLFDAEGHLRATLVAFPDSGWAGWSPDGKAWGSFDGLPRLRRNVRGRLEPLSKSG